MTKTKKAPERIGTQGWKQFVASKQEMLYQYDLAQKYADSHIVKVSHGKVAEAVFRKWLKDFLPEKYGVTSGYVVSQSESSIDLKLPHYDVIVYDKLNSPTLWIEESPDTSEQGHVRAVPAEYVCAVIEVKSKLTLKTSKDSLNKIRELKPLLRGDQKIKDFDGLLNSNFIGMSVFFELGSSNKYKSKILDNLTCEMDVPYYGGIILKGEERDIGDTGLFTMNKGIDNYESIVGKGKRSLFEDLAYSDSIQAADNDYVTAFLSWNPSCFSYFAFDLIAILEGRYSNRVFSSKYGMSWRNPDF